MQHNLFTEEQITTSSPAIAKPIVSRSTFYQGDCLVEMDKIADKSIDMILCDLPYGTTQNKWDAVIPFDILWNEYNRIIKANGAIVLTASQPFTSALIMSNPEMFRYDIVWHKRTASGALNAKKMPLRTHETILVFYKQLPTYNYQKTKGKQICGVKEHKINSSNYRKTNTLTPYIDDGTRYPTSVLDITGVVNNSKEKVAHPTQKPIALMEYLVRTYTNEGETVLDNCMGSGTTGCACKKTGRHFIGIEKDEKYFKLAVERVSAYCR